MLRTLWRNLLRLMRLPRWVLVLLGLVAFGLAIWFLAPLIRIGGREPFYEVWPRVLTIAAVTLAIGSFYLWRWHRRRRAEAALEEGIVSEQTGDGAVLAERMREALAVLRRSSGAAGYLYELPWYVIIGPPGAGKTTALLNSGLRFPLAEKGGGKDGDRSGASLGGVGGTRYCDWWFTEEAVLIDTAGRYTTQDSDAEADRESWQSFLALLKRHRPRQPVNGVIVALGLDELLSGTEASLAAHADAIRDRLMELHEVFRTDVPVYVLFTKSDLIAGFTEFFGAFSAARRQKVWGTTFRPAKRRDPTLPMAGPEFDALVRRLSVEVTDRMQDEPDGVSRIAIFGFPAQVAMLRDKVLAVLDGVFGTTRYKVNATLRGFYFASGTQEGTPIDQILGAMERSYGGPGGIGGGPSALSGQGRSYFLHDLLRKVIFPEAGWVSQDRGAVRREAALRYGAIAAVALVTLGLGTAWGLAYLQGRSLAAQAAAEAQGYAVMAGPELAVTEIADPDILAIEPLLTRLRQQHLDFAAQTAGLPERLGLGQAQALAAAARVAYRDGLERHLRPRLMLHLEERIAADYEANDLMSLYQSVKTYKLLIHRAPGPDDDAVLAWFRFDWAQDPRYRASPLGAPEDAPQARFATYLQDMLTLSATQGEDRLRARPHDELLSRVETRLQGIHLEDRAWLLTMGVGDPQGLEPFNLAFRAGPQAEMVFETRDGRALSEMSVPAVFTYAGFHRHFLPRLAQVAQELTDEYWVLGAGYDRSTVEAELTRLRGPIMNRYAMEFRDAWQAVLGNLRLRPVLADGPTYDVMNSLSDSRASPLLQLVAAVARETRLTADFFAEGSFGAGLDQLGGAAEGALPEGVSQAGGLVADRLLRSARERSSGLERLGFDVFATTQQAGSGGTRGGRGGTAELPGANVEALFARWHDLLAESGGQRNIDQLIGEMIGIRRLLLRSTAGPGQIPVELAAELAQLAGELSGWITRVPTPVDAMLRQMVEELRGGAADTAMAVLNQRLANEVTRVCERVVPESYPFAQRSSRDLPVAEFANLFGPQGVINRFFEEALIEHADISTTPWRWLPESRLGAQMSAATLAQFQRAAEIRDLYFPGGALAPGFDITIRAGALSPEVDSAILTLHGRQIISLPTANQPQVLFWPPPGGDMNVALRLEPDLPGRESLAQVQSGPWALLRLIEASRPRLRGTGVSFRPTLGGRHVDYTITAATTRNPFDMTEIRAFRCPRGL